MRMGQSARFRAGFSALSSTTAMGSVRRTGACVEARNGAERRIGARHMAQMSADGTMRKMLVLLVDDEPHIVEFLRMGFEYEGFEIAVATDGEEAVRQTLTMKPDVIILDVMLPLLS